MVYNRIRNQIFQSALPRGERLFPGFITAARIYFNPRSREGSDLHHAVLTYFRIISIRAPARGATTASLMGVQI